MTFLAIRQMMSKYFNFIGVGRPELIEKDFAVEKYATNEGEEVERELGGRVLFVGKSITNVIERESVTNEKNL